MSGWWVISAIGGFMLWYVTTPRKPKEDKALGWYAFGHKPTQPADRIKAKRTLRQSHRVFFAARKGDV